MREQCSVLARKGQDIAPNGLSLLKNSLLSLSRTLGFICTQLCSERKTSKRRNRRKRRKRARLKLTRGRKVQCNGSARRDANHDGFQRADIRPIGRGLTGGTRSPGPFLSAPEPGSRSLVCLRSG